MDVFAKAKQWRHFKTLLGSTKLTTCQEEIQRLSVNPRRKLIQIWPAKTFVLSIGEIPHLQLPFRKLGEHLGLAQWIPCFSLPVLQSIKQGLSDMSVFSPVRQIVEFVWVLFQIVELKAR